MWPGLGFERFVSGTKRNNGKKTRLTGMDKDVIKRSEIDIENIKIHSELIYTEELFNSICLGSGYFGVRL